MLGKKILRSSSKLTVFLNDFELEGVFKLGSDYIRRIKNVTDNKIWLVVMGDLKTLLKGNLIFEENALLKIPISYNPISSLQIRNEWLEKGIKSFSYLLDDITVPLPLDIINETYNINMN